MAPKTLEEFAAENNRRLINVESKLNTLLRREVAMTAAQASLVVGAMGDQNYGDRMYAQNGEDVVAVNIFRALGIAKPSYLDIGAHDPFKCSNTALLYSRGSRGINVDANPANVLAFRTQRPDDINLNVGVAATAGVMTFHMFDATSGLNTFSAEQARAIEASGRFKVLQRREIHVVTINDILRDHCPNGFPDFLSVDVEGLDLDILRSIDYSGPGPKLICVEANSSAYRKDIVGFMASKAYRLIFRAGANLFLMPAAMADSMLA
jgi:FkbM family methyltransferase